jgi:SNF2 family DNA or RNA helicase
MLNRSDLHAYQEFTVEFLKAHRECAIWIPMGLGKTVGTLTAFSDLRDQCEAQRLLVIGPKRVARRVWSDEVNAWSHLRGLEVSRIVGSEKECFDALRVRADIHTIGRERVPWLKEQFLEGRGKSGKLKFRFPWDVVAVDESQSFKSQSSQRWKALDDLRPYFPRLWELSGTPSPNGYSDLWSQFYLLDRGKRLGSTEQAFKERWFTPPAGMFTKWLLKPESAGLVRDAVKDIVLSLREEDYLNLPPISNNFIRVTLSPAAMATYKRMEREYIAEVAGKKLSAVNAGVLDGKLLQLANGAVYHAKGEWVPFHDAKLEALDETLEALPGKVLIAYSYRHDLARIQKVLEKRGKEDGKTWAVLKTDDSFDAWVRGEIDWGILHPASAGHGLNDMYRAGCSDIIHFGLTNNLEWYQQVNARIGGGHRRVGKNIRVHHIVADGTRDDDYVGLLRSKAATQDDLTGSLAVRIGGCQ